MALRADRARKQLADAAKAVPDAPEIAKIVDASHTAGLKLNNEKTLSAAADTIAAELMKVSEKYDGSTMSGLDELIPGADKLKGSPRNPTASR
jgi:hypothetical protein